MDKKLKKNMKIGFPINNYSFKNFLKAFNIKGIPSMKKLKKYNLDMFFADETFCKKLSNLDRVFIHDELEKNHGFLKDHACAFENENTIYVVSFISCLHSTIINIIKDNAILKKYFYLNNIHVELFSPYVGFSFYGMHPDTEYTMVIYSVDMNSDNVKDIEITEIKSFDDSHIDLVFKEKENN